MIRLQLQRDSSKLLQSHQQRQQQPAQRQAAQDLLMKQQMQLTPDQQEPQLHQAVLEELLLAWMLQEHSAAAGLQGRTKREEPRLAVLQQVQRYACV